MNALLVHHGVINDIVQPQKHTLFAAEEEDRFKITDIILTRHSPSSVPFASAFLPICSLFVVAMGAIVGFVLLPILLLPLD